MRHTERGNHVRHHCQVRALLRKRSEVRLSRAVRVISVCLYKTPALLSGGGGGGAPVAGQVPLLRLGQWRACKNAFATDHSQIQSRPMFEWARWDATVWEGSAERGASGMGWARGREGAPCRLHPSFSGGKTTGGSAGFEPATSLTLQRWAYPLSHLPGPALCTVSTTIP